MTTSIHVPQGCPSFDYSPTTAITVTLDTAILIAAPGHVQGWNVTTTTQTLDPPQMAGKHNMSSRTDTIKWSGGPLPNGEFLDFPMRIFLPSVEDQSQNETIWIKVLQECESGSDNWNQVKTDPGYNADLKHDAMALTVNVQSNPTYFNENRGSDNVYAEVAADATSANSASSLAQNSIASLVIAGFSAYFLV